MSQGLSGRVATAHARERYCGPTAWSRKALKRR